MNQFERLTLLIDLQSDCILCMASTPSSIAVPTFNALKQTMLDTEVRLLSANSAVLKDISFEAVRTKCLYLGFANGSYQLKSLELEGDALARQIARKKIAVRKLHSIERLLWLELQNLKECISYQGLDYEYCIARGVAGDSSINEYASINSLTNEQALRELEFDLNEIQNKKMRIYAWHKHFVSKISACQSNEELDNVDANINAQLWRDALI